MSSRRRGWGQPIRPRSWTDLAAVYAGPASTDVGHVTAIIESVLASPHRSRLAATTSMHDLVVTDTPDSDSPEVIVVRAPGSMREPPTGMVRVEHLSLTGHDDVIDRPTRDAVPLFWRFVHEKFGIDGDAEPQ